MDEESKKSPDVKKSEIENPLFSPGFRSVAEMAGWDEEALLIASLVVEETPDRNPKQRKRTILVKNSATPPENSKRKRAKAQTASPMPVTVLNLDEARCQKEAMDSELSGGNNEIGEPSKAKKFNDLPSSSSSSSSSSRSRSADPPPAIPCIDKLREELSCAICLEICFEPSTTPCGHSFCKKCLRSAANKCGKKCPKCRQLISNARSCTVNTVLWNTIQLLFPEEVEARKKAAAIAKDAQEETPAVKNHHHHQHDISRSRRVPVLINSPERMNPRDGGAERRNFGLHGRMSSSRRSDFISVARPRRGEVEDEYDAALALRLQREEYMGMGSNNGEQELQQEHRRNSLALARANLRAVARALCIRRRT